MTTTFDRVGFLQRTAGDAKLISDLASTFLKSIKSEWQILLNAVISENYERVEQQAHSLKNSCQVFFKGDLISNLHQIEVSARNCDLKELKIGTEKLKSEWDNLQELLQFIEELII